MSNKINLNNILLDKDLWYKNLKKSKLNPPSWVFGVMWPILYTSMIIYLITMIRYYNGTTIRIYKYIPLILFTIQLFFNLIWTTLFFKLKRFRLALLDLFLTLIFTIATIIFTIKINLFASLILIPYTLWLSFATYLNIFIVLKN
tara:strand:+ start:483 stop:917 length:435 start_codon:yes stop_codon:yes gene_type:complete